MSNQDPFASIEAEELTTVSGGVGHGHHKKAGKHKKLIDELAINSAEVQGSLHRHRRRHHG